MIARRTVSHKQTISGVHVGPGKCQGKKGTSLEPEVAKEAYLLNIVARKPLKGVVNEGCVDQWDENLGPFQCDWPEALRKMLPSHVACCRQHVSCMQQ